MSEALLQQARELHRAGRLAEAIAAYGRLTTEEPQSAEHWKLKAMAEHAAGQLLAALQDIQHAVNLAPGDAAIHLVAGYIAEDMADGAAATSAFQRATELRPDWAAAWMGLGSQRLAAARPTEAADCFRRALDITPQAARAWNNLGMAQVALDKLQDAQRAFAQAINVEPGYALAHFNLARVADMRGDAEEALKSATRATQLDPRNGEAHLLVGDIHRRARAFGKAEQAYAAAGAVPTSAAKAANALADLYWETGFDDRARELYGRVSRDNPANLKAALGSRLLLPVVYESAAHLAQSRERYAQGLDELHSTADRFRSRDAATALSDARWTNFYLAYQGGRDRELQARFGDFMHRVLQAGGAGKYERPDASPRRDGRLRVGFASWYFYNCTAGRYFASWILGLDPARFETFVYYFNPWVANDTRTIAAAAGTFRHLAGRAISNVAEHIRADALDILVYPELGMNPETFTLGSLRLAPVQVAGWGHPTTTGLPTIDWFLSSAEMEPADAQQDYTEKLALLPGLGTRYALPRGEEAGTRTEFGLPEGKRLYLVPQSIFKIHPDNDALIAQVLARDPEGMAVMFAASHDVLTDRFVNRLAPVFKQHGIDVSKRVLFMPYMTHGAYLHLNRLCDVMLDTVHWSGGNTSLDALAMGLPVITLPGHLMRGRQSLGMLKMLGVEGLAAKDAEDFVARSVEIARDPDRRQALSKAIVDAHGRLFDRPEPVAAFADFLERAGRAG